tara:strand:+ start:57 stop:467 length:411 start_codon:yes stop_codon:yes gene_type:complete
MIILRENNAKEVNEKLKAGKYNGYAYIQVAKKLKPGHERILRIGETGISKNGLTTYRPVRGIREWKQADGKQTNLLGKYFLRNQLVTFIFPTHRPCEHKMLEQKFKQNFFRKHKKSPRFDKDNGFKHLISNVKYNV